MSELSERPGGSGEARSAQSGPAGPSGQQNPAAPTAAELAIGRHERGGDAERTSLFNPEFSPEFNPDRGPGADEAGPAGERQSGHGADQLAAGAVAGAAVPPWQRINATQSGSSGQAGQPESMPTTEVKRPGGGTAVSVDQTTVQTRTPANGQLGNPFGGADPDPGSAATTQLDRNAGQQQPPLLPPQQPSQQPPPPNRPTARPNVQQSRVRAARAPRKASLQIRRFDPWSVLKLTLVLSVAMFLMWLVAVAVLYGVLNGMGVWDKLNGAWDDLASVNETGGGEELISAGRVFGFAAIVGAVNVVLFTAFATVLAFVYNVSADMAGGIEVTLSERD